MFKIFIYVIRHLVIVFIVIFLDGSNLQTWFRVLFLWIIWWIVTNIDIHFLYDLFFIRLIIIIKVRSLLQIHLSRCSIFILLLFWFSYSWIWVNVSKSWFLILISHFSINIGHVWHIWRSSFVLLILLLHEHQMSLLEQFIILHILLVHVKILIPISISSSWLKVHILILKIDNV